MDPDAYRREILKERYEEDFQQAEAARNDDDNREAARYYSRAADTLRQLAEATGTDRTTAIDRLEQAAELLRRGERLEDHFKKSEATEASGDSDSPAEGSGAHNPPGTDDGDDEDTRRRMESFICETETTWTDIGGLETVQQQLKWAVALGSITDLPEAVSATDRLLMFGPPGTGKTLLASAVAGSLDATFFQVELGTLLSKWYGESSKQISALFETAADLAPSVIFLDEVDSLTQSRSSDMDETSRRVLDTLLSELDGVEKTDDSFVLTLAATNTPWALDSAIRSRFPQRIHVPLPDETAGTEIIRIHTVDGGINFEGRPAEFLPDRAATTDATTPPEAIARRCVEAGYSGRDMEGLCREAINNMITRHNPDLATLVDESIEQLRSHSLEVGPLQPRDVRHAFERTSPSLPEEDVARFYEWADEYGT